MNEHVGILGADSLSLSANRTFYTLAALTALLILSFCLFGQNRLLENEAVYLIPSKQMVDPTFLQGDWLFGNQAKIFSGAYNLKSAIIWKKD